MAPSSRRLDYMCTHVFLSNPTHTHTSSITRLRYTYPTKCFPLYYCIFNFHETNPPKTKRTQRRPTRVVCVLHGKLKKRRLSLSLTYRPHINLVKYHSVKFQYHSLRLLSSLIAHIQWLCFSILPSMYYYKTPLLLADGLFLREIIRLGKTPSQSTGTVS